MTVPLLLLLLFLLLFIAATFSSALVRIPPTFISIPLQLYGNSTNVLPSFASCSILYPGAGSFESSKHLANLSNAFPTAISIVSPKILYLLSLYAMTCVFPPLAYNTTGFLALVTNLPISMCAMQWFTVWIGLFQIWPSVRTTNATTIKHAPIPGPLVKQITSISSPKSFKENEPEVVVLNASRKASSVKSKSTFLWWLAVSRGRKPLPVGAQYVRRLLLKIVPSLVTIPTPILFADPSKPMANVLFFFLGGFGAVVVADIFLRFLFFMM